MGKLGKIGDGTSHDRAYNRTQTKKVVKEALKSKKKAGKAAAVTDVGNIWMKNFEKRINSTPLALPPHSPTIQETLPPLETLLNKGNKETILPLSNINVKPGERLALPPHIPNEVPVSPTPTPKPGERLALPPHNEPPKTPKFKLPKLSKAGKIGLILGAVALLGTIGAGIAGYLIGKNANKSSEEENAVPAVVNPEGEVPAVANPEDEAVSAVVNPEDEVPAVVNPEDEQRQNAREKVYEVKKGDNIWNIAKRILTEENNGVKPSDKEILKLTREIIQENHKEFEADGYTVIILPGEKLNIPGERVNLAA